MVATTRAANLIAISSTLPEVSAALSYVLTPSPSFRLVHVCPRLLYCDSPV